MTVHKVGIIGLGGMGRMMLADMARHSGFSAVAAWDPDQKTCDAVLGDNPSISIPASADALINRLDIDLVYIASPPKTHKLYFEHAIAAGIPVYCEKPFGVDLPESQDLVRRIEQANLPNIINFNHGNALGSTHIDQQIRAGAMGDVVNVDILIHLTEWPRAFQKTATWLAKRDQGGFTREMLSHWLYLTRLLLGEGEISRAHVAYPADGISAETHLSAKLVFGNVPAFIHATTGGAGPIGTEYTVWGEKRSYRLHSDGRISSSDGGPWREKFTDMADIGAADRQRNLDGVARRLNGEIINMPDAADGLAVQELIEALLTYTD